MKAHKHLIKYSLAKGYAITVFDGEEYSLRNSTSAKAVLDEVEGCDCPQIIILDGSRNVASVAIFIDGDELYTVQDYTVCDFMNEWDDAWSSKYDK